MGSWAIPARTVSYDSARSGSVGRRGCGRSRLQTGKSAVVTAGGIAVPATTLAAQSVYFGQKPVLLGFRNKRGREIFPRPHLTSSDLSSSR
jgi:hypothetical protein